MSSRQTEFSHVKTNLVHQLYQVRKFGTMPLEHFSELLSAEELEKCRNSVKRGWTNLQADVFTSLMFRVSFILSLFYAMCHSPIDCVMLRSLMPIPGVLACEPGSVSPGACEPESP